jgi:hypothetical protein
VEGLSLGVFNFTQQYAPLAVAALFQPARRRVQEVVGQTMQPSGGVAVAAPVGRRPDPGAAPGTELSGPGLRAGRPAGSLRGRGGRRHDG